MIVEGKWFDLDEGKTRTLTELANRYMKERSSQKSSTTCKRDEGIFKHLLSFFGGCALADITSRRVSEYKNMRILTVDGQTVKKELGVLRNAFNVATKEWEWVKDNPVSRVSLPKDPPGRVRFLSKEEIERLLESSEKWFMPILVVAIHTGLRQGNLITLTWDKVDLAKRLITLDAPEMKNEENLGIPIGDTLFETLRELQTIRQL